MYIIIIVNSYSTKDPAIKLLSEWIYWDNGISNTPHVPKILTTKLTLRFSTSHLFNLQTEFVLFVFVQTLQVPQFSFLVHPVQEPQRLLRTRFFFAREVGDSLVPAEVPATAELSSLALISTPPSPPAVDGGRVWAEGETAGSLDTGTGFGTDSSKRKTGGWVVVGVTFVGELEDVESTLGLFGLKRACCGRTLKWVVADIFSLGVASS